MNKIKFFIVFIMVLSFQVGEASPLLSVPGIARCPENLILHENLQSGARNGYYNPYTKGVVTEAHLLQKHLNRLGFLVGLEDGKLGIRSDKAIKRMQKFFGVDVDGVVGPRTRALLNHSCFSESWLKDSSCSLHDTDCFVKEMKEKHFKNHKDIQKRKDEIMKKHKELIKQIQEKTLERHTHLLRDPFFDFDWAKDSYRVSFIKKNKTYTFVVDKDLDDQKGIFCKDGTGFSGFLKNQEDALEPGVRCKK